ncbi:hypothetical protein ACFQY7_52235 [Actinomadura luteofluorescens]|uniref:hypothetical protein n=1 Tax=Actinomadura luteofluorescens TaxID=46163 RepID=UPI00363F5EF5
MLGCARGLLRAAQWSRAPTVLTQLFALPIAWSLWQSDRPAIAVPLGAVAVLALITVLSPPSTAWLIDDHDEDGDTPVNDTETAEPAAAPPPESPAPSDGASKTASTNSPPRTARTDPTSKGP